MFDSFKYLITSLDNPFLGGSITIVSNTPSIFLASLHINSILFSLFSFLLILAFLILDSFISTPVILSNLLFNHIPIINSYNTYYNIL